MNKCSTANFAFHNKCIFTLGFMLLSSLFFSSAMATGVYKPGWELPPEAQIISADAGDIDNDGDNDIVVTNFPYTSVKVYLNDGSGQLSKSLVVLGFPKSAIVRLVDLDSDGDVDGVATQETGKAGVWLNDGSGLFTKTAQELGSTSISGLVPANVNGDGHEDLLLQNSNGVYEVWVNTGPATFINSGSVIGSSSVSSLVFGDFDGDGDNDAWVSQAEAGDRVWLNDGTGAFTDSGTDHGPLDVAPFGIDVGDVDGDLDIDVYTAYGYQFSSDSGFQVADILWRNDGAANFVAEDQVAGASQISLIDLNLDGFVDRALASGYSLNDGSGSFTGGWQGFGTTVASGGYIFSNLNTNLAPDLYQGNLGYDKVWLNDGVGNFSDTDQNFGINAAISLELGDVDGDGDIDAWHVGYSGQPDEVWLNDGTGNYVNSGQEIFPGDCEAISFGDLDGDSDLDAWIGCRLGDPHRVYLNNGSGVFSDSGQSLTNSLSNYARDVELGDVDGDGDLDAWVAQYFAPNTVWVNNGAGLFTDSGQLIGPNDYTNNARAVGLGDVDGDGDLDAWVARWYWEFYNNPSEVWLNDGNGVFSNSGQALEKSHTRDITLADVDGDLDLDAFIANFGGPNKVWLNDGSGIFTDSGQNLGNSDSRSVAMDDVNDDGVIDAWVANDNTNVANKVWLNDGSGIFLDTNQALGGSQSNKVQLGDLNGDGKLDAMVTNWFGDSRVWVNMDDDCSTATPLLTTGDVYTEQVYCGAETKITAGPLSIESGADVTFFSPLIELLPDFVVKNGGVFGAGDSPLVNP